MSKEDAGPSQTAALEEVQPNTVVLRKSQWTLLRRIARARADLHGGRVSISGVIDSLIERNRKALIAELERTTAEIDQL